MPDTQKQVFLTNSPTRWQRFKWSFRIILFVAIVLLIILGIAVVYVLSPAMPVPKTDNSQYQALLDNGKNAAISNINKKYEGFGKYITGKSAQLKHIRYVSKADSLHHMSA